MLNQRLFLSILKHSYRTSNLTIQNIIRYASKNGAVPSLPTIQGSEKSNEKKWSFLEHRGPVFAKPYERLPTNIHFYYDGKPLRLSEKTEEIATFYSRMLDHEYTSKPIFNRNFFKDWRSQMTPAERKIILNLDKCDFKEFHEYFKYIAEKNKNRTKEEKAAIKAENELIANEFGYCVVNGVREKIGNFRIEPPGLFRGRGEHPKMGSLKERVHPEDVIINCSADSKWPEPPIGHRWKEIRHDPTAIWLACWMENLQNKTKYVMLNASSLISHSNEMEKYEMARRLSRYINKIRKMYRNDWKSDNMKVRQRAIALYFIDKLALRAGTEKNDNQVDTVGCCSLRVEHLMIHRKLNGKRNVVVFDFLGKDSIRYYNEVSVEKQVFENLELFKENKRSGDELFECLSTNDLNKYLHDLMDGLTAKVFRTYNASSILQKQLTELTDSDMSLPEKLLAYNRANRAVAVLCNHQRAVPKSFEKSMENIKSKIDEKRKTIEELEIEIESDQLTPKVAATKTKKLEKCRHQLKLLEMRAHNQDENKSIALGTSKLNYLDPRISIAWCQQFKVPVEKIYSGTQRDRFSWAIESTGPDFKFE